ncbi:response regulator transcription factor [Perlabentimonas gracilis]|uniref:response regulator transcription factor n=1 Tax=Perlabentimonas gracilis TaxID=2715279 RepID=UPI00140CC174|nr:response regulator transcription factor [Perlabentimonas gracilis]NHB69210.1 response regulator transcription factor [Perlabentimonas gracilis]
MKTKIAIVDDHRIIRDGIKALLLGDPNFELVFEAASAQGLKASIGDTRPDLVLLDIILPDISGLDLIEFFKNSYSCRVLMLTAEMDEAIVCEAVSKGADGFLNKDSSGEELIFAMKTVMEGEPYFGQSLSSIVFRSFKRKIDELKSIKAMPHISDREKEIIHHLSNGLSFKEIGSKLFISPRTVENHKNNLLEKLELRNSIELIKFAIKNDIVSLE